MSYMTSYYPGSSNYSPRKHSSYNTLPKYGGGTTLKTPSYGIGWSKYSNRPTNRSTSCDYKYPTSSYGSTKSSYSPELSNYRSSGCKSSYDTYSRLRDDRSRIDSIRSSSSRIGCPSSWTSFGRFSGNYAKISDIRCSEQLSNKSQERSRWRSSESEHRKETKSKPNESCKKDEPREKIEDSSVMMISRSTSPTIEERLFSHCQESKLHKKRSTVDKVSIGIQVKEDDIGQISSEKSDEKKNLENKDFRKSKLNMKCNEQVIRRRTDLTSSTKSLSKKEGCVQKKEEASTKKEHVDLEESDSNFSVDEVFWISGCGSMRDSGYSEATVKSDSPTTDKRTFTCDYEDIDAFLRNSDEENPKTFEEFESKFRNEDVRLIPKRIVESSSCFIGSFRDIDDILGRLNLSSVQSTDIEYDSDSGNWQEEPDCPSDKDSQLICARNPDYSLVKIRKYRPKYSQNLKNYQNQVSYLDHSVYLNI